MIVRIMGEGQVAVDDARLAELNTLDDELLAAVRSGDEAAFHRTLGALLDGVRAAGSPLPDDALEPSQLILPAAEATLEEVRAMLDEDGLIPG
ncbi:PspA-associated protein PspAA [Actinacidiphila guanduensis]|uniref:PspA-associated domain-containing protein n=1 Tax=Actinacidiphila guanduensis TaxID=310781 RepID=A0A1H0DGB5_9ACTN|nr:hypothetical protein [Actinacidiphila guanduensis]SDN69148.1 hypothetical protein SAMN05216259_105207 [Actinacidiphila guanduensis]